MSKQRLSPKVEKGSYSTFGETFAATTFCSTVIKLVCGAFQLNICNIVINNLFKDFFELQKQV